MTAEPAFVVPPLGGAPPTTPERPVHELAGEALGTSWSVKTAGGAVPRGAVEAVLDEVAAEMSAWRSDSALSRFNAAAPGAWIALPPGLVAVLRCALEVAEASGGAFDPTVGACSDAWGFGPSGPVTEPPADPTAPLGWSRLRIDGGGRAFQPGGLVLDVSGIGKGWAVDRLAALCGRRGARSYLCEIGGEFVGSGLHPEGRPWLVALEPARPGAPSPATVALHAGALATSGDARRALAHGGRRFSHTLDPRTGAPIPEGVVSVSVWAESAMRADALATAITVLGREAGLAFADAQGVAALMTTREPEGLTWRASRAWREMSEGG